MNPIKKLISGDTLRRTRLHDEKGNRASWRNIALHSGPALGTGLLRLGIGYRPQLPWIAYSSIKLLEDFLQPTSRVLEFGSGMSTLWYSQHAGQVCSVEDYRPWYDKISTTLSEQGRDNVDYQFAADATTYSNFKADDPQGFDLIMVDGKHRDQCMAAVTDRVNPGGILYLDNSDKDSGPNGGAVRIAEQRLRERAARAGAPVHEITDFAPTQLFVQQGIWVQL